MDSYLFYLYTLWLLTKWKLLLVTCIIMYKIVTLYVTIKKYIEDYAVSFDYQQMIDDTWGAWEHSSPSYHLVSVHLFLMFENNILNA